MLRITLFGRMNAVAGEDRPVLLRSRKTRAVLAILALSANRTVLRTRIAGLLWSLREKEQARASLRQALHELQEALGPDAADVLRADRNHLALSQAGVWVDAVAFAAATPSNADALALFSPTLLEDLHGLDPAFDRWIADQAEHLAQVARVLGEAILAQQCEPDGRQRAAEQLLTIDRTHDMAWRAVIASHLERGDLSAALTSYERCRSVLAQAGLPAPSPEIQALAEQIRAARTIPLNPPGQMTAAAPQRLGRSTEPAGVRLGVVPLRTVEQEGADGLALGLMLEIATALAQFRWINCVPHGSGEATIPGRPGCGSVTDLDFLLDGTIQRAGGRVRIIARLSDMRTGGSLVWSHRFDRSVSDVFALQDDIAAEVVAQIDAALLLWEARRTRLPTAGDPTVLDLLLRAIPSLCRLEPQWFRKAGDLLETAIERDPANASVHAWLAHWHLFLVGQGWAPDMPAAMARAAELADRAMRLDARDARAITLAGHVSGFLNKRPEEAQVMHDRAIALNPNLALAWCMSGLVRSYLGDHAEASRRIQHAQRLSPHDPHTFFFDTAQIMPHLLRGEYARAADIGRRATALNPGFTSALKGRLAALGHLGRDAEAADVRARLLVLEPGFCLSAAAARSPMARDEDIALYIQGLRRAGLPE